MIETVVINRTSEEFNNCNNIKNVQQNRFNATVVQFIPTEISPSSFHHQQHQQHQHQHHRNFNINIIPRGVISCVRKLNPTADGGGTPSPKKQQHKNIKAHKKGTRPTSTSSLVLALSFNPHFPNRVLEWYGERRRKKRELSFLRAHTLSLARS
jgi:hypothetical protein